MREIHRYIRRSYVLHHTFLIHDVGFETQHSKHHECGQYRGQEVDNRDQHGIKMAVVVSLIVTGKSDDPSETQTKSKEDLSGSFTPHLWLQHDLQLKLNTFKKLHLQYLI